MPCALSRASTPAKSQFPFDLANEERVDPVKAFDPKPVLVPSVGPAKRRTSDPAPHSAAAAKLGMDCHILLEDRTGYNEPNYRLNGNVLLDVLHGATIEHRGPGLDMNAEMFAVAERMKAEGRKPYAIVGGGSNATGALGYVTCALELLGQMVERGLVFDHMVTATGSAGTHSGLIVGLKALNAQLPLLGIGVRAPKDVQEGNVFRLAQAVEEKVDTPGVVRREDVVANCDYIGKGYGIPAESTLEAIDIFAKQEAILLDPVYSGKGAAGLIDLCRKGHFTKGQRIVFLHTGGAIGLTGYTHVLRHA